VYIECKITVGGVKEKGGGFGDDVFTLEFGWHHITWMTKGVLSLEIQNSIYMVTTHGECSSPNVVSTPIFLELTSVAVLISRRKVN